MSMTETHDKGTSGMILYDRVLISSVLALLVLGLLMVASSTMAIAERKFNAPFYYFFHQLFYIGVGTIAGIIVFKLPLRFWEKMGIPFLLITTLFLLLVLIPGIGRQVNGSMRWLGIGPFGLQISEFAKLSMIIYFSSYILRHEKQVRTQIRGFLKPFAVALFVTTLLLKEPDFGAATVILITSLGLLFLAGVRFYQFAILFTGVGVTLAVLALSSPYRLVRLTTFLNPWANQFDSGYQLTQSLIAFGRGGWWGVGLGESVQKLFYLPEAHTDFLFAVLSEELGLMGALVMLILFALVVFRSFWIGRACWRQGSLFAANVAFGIGLNLSLQVMINIGVNTGLLPTKGLTLPLMSYGGSSLIVNLVMVALLLRIDRNMRLAKFGFRKY